MRIVFPIALALVLSACAMPPQSQPVQRLAFNEAEYAALPKSGTGIVRGQVFAKQRGGSVVKGAGSTVLLNPVTSLSTQWFDEARRGNELTGEMDPRYAAAGRHATADADGRFQFSDVPPGEYFVVSAVEWEAVTQFGVARQGGTVANKVTVENNRVSDVMLSR